MNEQLHIIDNKKILLTFDEWKLYQEICKSYDHEPEQHGKDYFQGLFESNEQGMIQFIRPPTNPCPYEVVWFMIAVMVHQRLREAAKAVNEMKKSADAKIGEAAKSMNDRFAALEKRIIELEGKTK